MTTSEDHTLKNEHLQLAGVIKGVHKQLRRQFRESGGDYSNVWKNHLKDKDALLCYAHAMKNLAEQHWAVYPETRIDWCHKVIVEYFLCDGWRKALEKDAKREYFEQKRQMQSCCGDFCIGGKSSTESGEQRDICVSMSEQINSGNGDSVDKEHSPLGNAATAVTSLDEAYRTKYLSLPSYSKLLRLARSDEKIKLLDVGSCYNAFQVIDNFDSVGIDLCPANETVYQCDFLELQVTPANADQQQLPPLTSPVSQMPGSSFHVVVFSLLLEYLPSPDQRYLCCVKAHSLLDMHGLLLLVTPDSHSQHRNAPMMKSWKKALEWLGFSRWKYEKKEHIHCMAYRKVSELSEDFTSAEIKREVADLLYIPQDFNDACYDNDDGNQNLKPTNVDDDEDEEKEDDAKRERFVATVENELPFFLFLDSNGSSDDDENDKNQDDKR